MPTIILAVPDISCGHCVATITQALKGLRGVSRTTVDVQAKRASVQLADEKLLPQVLSRLDAEGYPATVVPA